ncbi:hypothetical protein AAVH_27515 [Aphelenchoides avenae]|nr:hypothetical protein AAVH_27515 [Aphelenchus avenae]
MAATVAEEVPACFMDAEDYVGSFVRWNRRRLTEFTLNEEKALEFIEELGLLPKSRECGYCRRDMSIKKSKKTGQFGSFVCKVRGCQKRDKEFPRAKNTWFSGVHLKPAQLFSIMYSFCRGESYEQAVLEAATDAHLLRENQLSMSHQTISDWYSFCREMVVNHYHDLIKEKPPIGGPGSIIEIDESKFGRRKYNRGRRVHGHWVVGMIDKETKDLRLVICPWCPIERPDGWRDADALLPMIQKHVAVGSTIHTDAWKAYSGLSQLGYVHKVVNHSDPENRFVAADGTHTNTIEATWRPAKVYFANKRIRHADFGAALTEYAWRRECKRQKQDPFDAFLHIVKLFYQKPAWNLDENVNENDVEMDDS